MTKATREFKNELNERMSMANDIINKYILGYENLTEDDTKVIINSYNDPDDYYEFDTINDAIDAALEDLKYAVIWTVENLPENPCTRNLKQYTDLAPMLFDAISTAQYLEEVAFDHDFDITSDGTYYNTSYFYGRRKNFEYSYYDCGGMVGQICRLFNNREFY